jgi:hypothetical protein
LRSVSFWLWDFAAAAGKALHSNILRGLGVTLSVGREVKTEIPVV